VIGDFALAELCADTNPENFVQAEAAGIGDADSAADVGAPDPVEFEETVEQAASERPGEMVALFTPVDAVSDHSPVLGDPHTDLVEEGFPGIGDGVVDIVTEASAVV